MKSQSIFVSMLRRVVTVGPLLIAPGGAVAADAAPAPAAAKPAPATPSGTTLAQSTVRITWRASPEASPPDVTAAVSRLASVDVGGEIGREVLGLPPEEAIKTIGDPRVRMNGQDIVADIIADVDPTKFPGARPAAKEFVSRLVSKLSDLLVEERRTQSSPASAGAKERMAEAQYEYETLLRRLQNVRTSMAGKSGRVDASPETVGTALTKLEDERQHLELELAGMQARQAAVEEWVARKSKQVEAQAKEDPVVAELEKAVAAQEKVVTLARRMYDAGTTPFTDVTTAEAKLSEIKIQLLDRRNGAGAASAPGGDALAALNRELQNLSIDVVDRKARLDYAKRRLDTLQAAAELVPEFEALQAERAGAQRELELARLELRTAHRNETLPVDRVIVTRSQAGHHTRPDEASSPQ